MSMSYFLLDFWVWVWELCTELCISNGLDISITYQTEIGVEATKAQGINFDGSSSFAHAL